MKEKKTAKNAPVTDSIEEFEDALAREDDTKYLLRLFVSGMTPNSRKAVENVKKLCEEHLKGRYELEIIDIYQQPELAREGQILAAPTLLKKLPLPLRKFIGDMSNAEQVLLGLDLRTSRPSGPK